MSDNLINYYRDRAKEYEKIYLKPERQEDIQAAVKILKHLFENKKVLEIACGTGFWTQFIAETAASILATDVNASVMEVAKQKQVFAATHSHVKFELADFYSFKPAKKFDSLFGGFIYSHILKQDLDLFFKTINKFVEKNGSVVLMDNLYVKGSNLPITETDDNGNTYQARTLEDGSYYKVLKNFPTENFLRKKIEADAQEIQFIQWKHFWILSYKLL